MKKRTKGILAFAFLGGIMVTSGVTIAIPGIVPEDESMRITETGTPADNFPDVQRPQFCGEGVPGSTPYVTEYAVPTPCTLPLAMTSDPSGRLWFVQTNTGMVASFDPLTETFEEFENPVWPRGARSMMWGADYSADNSIWYSDEVNDAVWNFSIDREEYRRVDFPAAEAAGASMPDPLPQRVMVDGSQIIVNDLFGNKITLLDASPSGDAHVDVPSPLATGFAGGFAKGPGSQLWYTSWDPGAGGLLVSLDMDGYRRALAEGADPSGSMMTYELPATVQTVNGIVESDGLVWMADTSTSNFYSFSPADESFTRYTSARPIEASYGNQTGIVTSPLSRPYWADLHRDGRVVFNEQTANRISLFDPQTETLTGYDIPSRNPLWADCGDLPDCGLAQAFDFEPVGDKIWYTGWVTNTIGAVDTSAPLPFSVSVEPRTAVYGVDDEVVMTVSASAAGLVSVEANASTPSLAARIPLELAEFDVTDGMHVVVPIGVFSEAPEPGTYKMLVGARADGIVVGQYVTAVVP